MPFLVTGAGRCGTHYVCEALNRLGVATGHEDVFAYDEATAGEWGDLEGDCSWPGAAYPHRLPPNTPVLQLVREPLAMVRSRVGDNNLGHTSSDRVVASFVGRHRPDIFHDAADDVGRALLFVARWNRQVEAIHEAFPRLPFRRVQIEALSTDAAVLAGVISFLTGDDVDLGPCQEVIDRLDHSIGSRAARSSIGWEQVVAHANGSELVDLARDYGYATRRASSGGAD